MIDYAALRSELATDPLALGYAALTHVANDVGVAAILNARNYTMIQPLPWGTVVKWGASIGLRSKVEDASKDKTNTARDVALVFLDFVGALGTQTAITEGTLDVTDPAVVGAMADGKAYKPGVGAITYPGLLDALVFAEAGTPLAPAPLMTSANKDALINLGIVPASRAEVLFGYGTVVSPSDVSNSR